MTDLAQAATLVELLDRQFGLVLATREPRRFLYLLKRLVETLCSEPSLAGIVVDIRREAADSIAAYIAHEERILVELRRLFDKSATTLEDNWLNVPEHLEGAGAKRTASSFRKSLKKTVTVRLKGYELREEDPGSAGALVTELRRTVSSAKHKVKPKKGKAFKSLDQLDMALKTLTGTHRMAYRALLSQIHADPAFAMCRMDALAAATNPPSLDANAFSSDVHGLARALCDEIGLAAELHNPSSGEQSSVEQAAERGRLDAEVVREDLLFRIGIGRSRLSLMRRFAARCERYEATELLALCNADTKKAEASLTLRFAAYLFDSGLNPLVDPKIAGLRPDVFDTTLGEALYVEAKQYDGSKTEGAVTGHVRDAVGQMLDTWGRLAQTDDVREGFLLIFRRGGPRLELPDVLRFNGKRLYLVVADIAPAADSGSQQKHKPILLSTEQLLPKAVE